MYYRKLTSLHPPERSAVRGSVDFPAIWTQITSKFSLSAVKE
jgi:hypothetical protein